MAVRRDRHVTLVDQNDQYINSGNPLPVTLAGSGSGGTSQTDRTTFTDGTTTFTPVGGVFNDSATAPTAGQAATARITSARAFHVNLRKSDGTELSSDTSARLRVTGPVPDDGVSPNTAAPFTVGGEDSNGFARVSRMADTLTIPNFRAFAVAQYVFDPAQPTLWVRRTAYLGTHGNAWNAVATGVNGVSAVIDCQQQPFIHVLLSVSAATFIHIQFSQDGTTFYTHETFNQGAATFLSRSFTIGCRYVRLQSVSNSTVTATIAAKTG